MADLVDLEQELSSLQRGITQMERITPNDTLSQQSSSLTSSAANKTSNSIAAAGTGGDDPFGDSFTNFPVRNKIVPFYLLLIKFSNRLYHHPSQGARAAKLTLRPVTALPPTYLHQVPVTSHYYHLPLHKHV